MVECRPKGTLELARPSRGRVQTFNLNVTWASRRGPRHDSRPRQLENSSSQSVAVDMISSHQQA